MKGYQDQWSPPAPKCATREQGADAVKARSAAGRGGGVVAGDAATESDVEGSWRGAALVAGGGDSRHQSTLAPSMARAV